MPRRQQVAPPPPRRAARLQRRTERRPSAPREACRARWREPRPAQRAAGEIEEQSSIPQRVTNHFRECGGDVCAATRPVNLCVCECVCACSIGVGGRAGAGLPSLSGLASRAPRRRGEGPRVTPSGALSGCWLIIEYRIIEWRAGVVSYLAYIERLYDLFTYITLCVWPPLAWGSTVRGGAAPTIKPDAK